MSRIEEIIQELKSKTQDQEGIFYYLPKVTDFQKKEIEFHNKIYQDEAEVHQLNTLRNKFYHNYFKKYLYQLPQDSVILEIGSGSGYDLKPLIKKGYQVIASDISEESVKSIKTAINDQSSISNNKIIYLVADGQNLPLSENSVTATFMVATFHHFENQQKALAEIKRVTQKDGLIILAMEPSKFMMRFTKLFSQSKSLRIYHGHSEADETHQGYIKSDFPSVLSPQSSVLKLKRVWLLLGFLHYGLEAIYRIFKLKKRIKVPLIVEWTLLIIDEILLKIPVINQLNWHWIVVVKDD
ncbi:class I SAM-dependent methyltransferase [Patescibacteria group bacterium]|nr:class I SAM-dependent methyltransferase [Patescibacteria group bacterium]